MMINDSMEKDTSSLNVGVAELVMHYLQPDQLLETSTHFQSRSAEGFNDTRLELQLRVHEAKPTILRSNIGQIYSK